MYVDTHFRSLFITLYIHYIYILLLFLYIYIKYIYIIIQFKSELFLNKTPFYLVSLLCPVIAISICRKQNTCYLE